VSAAAPIVRPWNPPSNATTSWRPVACRASRTDASTASLPELRKKTLSSAGGSTSPSRSARRRSGWCITVVY
jgi:hypothetical protein